MVLEIKRLLAKGEYNGKISFDFVPEKEVLLVPLCSFDGAVSFVGEYEIFDGDEVELKFEITYKLKGQCNYCLEDAEKVINYSSEVLFVTDKDDLDNYYYDGVRLDLSKAISDALLMSQPDLLLCQACANAE
ncbi:MAG: YceD family protein [Candidatus Coproplasma sp.]